MSYNAIYNGCSIAATCTVTVYLSNWVLEWLNAAMNLTSPPRFLPLRISLLSAGVGNAVVLSLPPDQLATVQLSTNGITPVTRMFLANNPTCVFSDDSADMIICTYRVGTDQSTRLGSRRFNTPSALCSAVLQSYDLLQLSNGTVAPQCAWTDPFTFVVVAAPGTSWVILCSSR